MSEQWTEWIADNRLKGNTPSSMVQAMQRAGVDASLAEQAVSAIDSAPCFAAARKLQQMQRKSESVMANLFQLQQMSRDSRRILRRSSISGEDFFEHHYCANRPLILTEFAQHWPARHKWTLAWLSEHFGQATVEIQAGRDADPDYELNSLRHKREVKLCDFIDAISGADPQNDQYLTANNSALKRPELAPLLHDIGPLPNWFDPAQLPQQTMLWIGSKGVKTPLHHDTIQLMHTQIIGRKRWRLISPLQTPLLSNHIGVFSKLRLDEPADERYPVPSRLQVIEIILEPGQTLFLPVGWWHDVESLEPSISVSYTNFVFANRFEFDDPDIRDW